MSDKEGKTIESIVQHLRSWADRLPNDPDDGFWFERPCEQMQDILRGYADDIEEAGRNEFARGYSEGRLLECKKEFEFLDELLESLGCNYVR